MKTSTTSRLLGFLLLCFIWNGNLTAQDSEIRYRVRGKIINSRTRKPIKKIPVTVLPFNRVINADSKGAFLFNMPKGNYSLVMDYYPFIKHEVKLDVKSDTTLVIELQMPPGMNYLEEVEVIASRPATEAPAAIEQIDKRQLKTLPALIGERDVLKAFTLTAGVTSSGEGAADMQVRGGLHGQNLYLLDGIPLYSTEHFFGMVSAYNPTIIKSATLYKSDFPAEYGGKISSVVNVESEEANLKKFKGEAEIGMLTTKLALNIPLVSDKVALSIAGRLSNYSIADLVSALFGTSYHLSVHFGDINANLLWKLSEKDKLKLTFFSNTDGIDVQESWSNQINKTWIKNHQQNLGINWYKTLSDKVENHLLAYADNYGYDFGNSLLEKSTNEKQMFQILTGINSAGLMDKFKYNYSTKLKFTAGVSYKTYAFSPYQINLNDSNLNPLKPANRIRLNEGVVFAEGAYQLSKNQSLTVGLRLNSIGNAEKVYTNLEPRIGYHGIFANNYSISASIGRMTQPIHRVANSGLGFPFEMFYPSGVNLLPERSWNISLGGAKDFNWGNRKFSLKADAWYKTMENIVEFQDGYDAVYSTLFMVENSVISDAKRYLTQGNGIAYGVDFSANYNIQNWRLSADYTLMKAVSQFDQLNDGKPFASPTDIRNSISLTSELKLSDSWSFSASWQYNSGKPITVPTYIFATPTTYNKNIESVDYENTAFQRIVTQRNNYRTVPFHKLDVSFIHNFKLFKKYNSTISLGIYNVYNRANPFVYYIDTKQNADKSYSPVLKYMSLFPILPSFNWSVKF